MVWTVILILHYWTGNEALLNQRVCRIFVNENFTNKKYIFYGLDGYLRRINEVTSSVTVKHLSSFDIQKIPFPLPPLAEQTRIVAKLDAAFVHLETLKTSLARIPELIKKFHQTVLTQAVMGKLTEEWREENPDVESIEALLKHISKIREETHQKLTVQAKENEERSARKPNNINPKSIKDENNLLPEKWAILTFEDIAAVHSHAISSGPFGSALGTKDYRDEGIPVIRGQNVQPGYFVSNNFVYVSLEKATELKRSTALPGDIVIVAVGAGVGNAAIVPASLKQGVLSQNCNKFSIDQQLVIPSYILYCLQISGLKDQMNEFTTDTARQFLSLTNLKKIQFQIPPLQEQQEIVSRVEALFAQADVLEAQYLSLKAKIDKLPQALLAKAFRGELVPQNPTDEPASVLLEKIKVATASVGKKSRKTGQTELAFMGSKNSRLFSLTLALCRPS